MTTAREVKLKTLFQGKAWLHPKYLNIAKLNNTGLILNYKSKIMTIPADRINKDHWTKGDREFLDKFSGAPYYLYGIHFVPDSELND